MARSLKTIRMPVRHPYAMPRVWPWWAPAHRCHSAGSGSAAVPSRAPGRNMSFQKATGACPVHTPSLPDHHSSPLFQLAEKYGPIFTLHFGFQKVVVLTGYEVVREALVNYTEEFVDRPSIPIFDQIQNGNGTREMSGGGRVGQHHRLVASLTVLPRSPAFKHPPWTLLKPSRQKIFGFPRFHAMPPGFSLPSFLLMHLRPIHILNVWGWGVGFLKAPW